MPGKAEEPRAGRVRRARGRERRGALAQDVEHIHQRLDIVDERGLAEQTGLDGKRRLVPRLSPLPLYRVEERGLLAADVGAGAAAHLDVESKSRSGDVVANIAMGASLGDGVLDARPRQR